MRAAVRWSRIQRDTWVGPGERVGRPNSQPGQAEGERCRIIRMDSAQSDLR